MISRAGYRSTTPNEIGQLAQSFNRMADQTQKAFSELTEQGHQLEAVLQGMDDGVLAVDQYDNILLFNERVKVLLQNSGLKIGEKLDGSIGCPSSPDTSERLSRPTVWFVRKLSCPTRSGL